MAEKEQLKKRIQTRNGHRLVVRNSIAKARDAVTALNSNPSVDLQTQLESIRNSLQRKRDIIAALDQEISNLQDQAEIEKDILDRTDFEDELEQTICRIERALKSHTAGKPMQQSLTHAIDKVKLPKLSLMTFNGDPTQWTPFWESFESTIHTNTNLADIDKFKYLQRSLTGEAAQTITGLPLSNENYKTAVELLNKRFGNRQIIVSRHIECLMALPKITKEQDLPGMRQLYDKTESTVRSLTGIGISAESYGTLLTPIIMSKIPPEMRLLVSRKLKDEWDLSGTLKVLGEEISLREKCMYAPIEAANGSSGTQVKTKPRPIAESTTATFMVEHQGTARNTPYGIPFCLFCGNQHYSSSCTVVTNPDARKKILREKKRCFVCLRAGHISRNCRSSSKCFHCKGRHHATICGSKMDGNNQVRSPAASPATQSNASVNAPSSSNVSTLITSDLVNDTSILLQTARAKVHRVDKPDNEAVIRLILDSCSQKSYISARLRDHLQLPTVKTEKVIIKEFGNTTGTLKTCDSVQIAIKSADNLTLFINAFVVETICSPISNQTIDFAKSSYFHLQNLPLADRGDGNDTMEIDILVGADYLWNFMLDHVVRGEQGPVATLTRFGYVLSGPVQVPSHNEHFSNITIAHVLKTDVAIVNRNEDLRNVIHDFWLRESVNKSENDVMAISSENPIQGKIKFNGNGYEVTLPRVQNEVVLADNYTVALSRLNSLHERLQRKPDILQRYDLVIKEQLKAGIVEEVPKSEESLSSPGSVYYSPHREVIKEDRLTTKLRIVYDASSKRSDESSLNECLDPGPNLAPLIYDILLRFRMNKIALIGDLEKAFLSVSINPNQRDLLRFLWYDDISKNEPEITFLRFTRLVFGLTCSPFILNQTIRHHLDQYKEEDHSFVSTVEKSLYVDDFAFSMNSENDCFELYAKLKSCFAEGGFNMRKWATNSPTLAERIRKAEEKTATKSAEIKRPNNSELDISIDNSSFSETISNAICDNNDIKVLGIPWNRNDDTLKYEFSNFIAASESENVTKRTVLSTTAQFFDPVGLLSPIIVPLKVIFQTICQLKVAWDDSIPSDLRDEWMKAVNDIAKVKYIEVPRCVLMDVNVACLTSIELHGFCDASKICYAACVYARIVTAETVEVRLITSKTHVAPQRGETIPRLELRGALLLAELMYKVQEIIKDSVCIDSIVYWSDSQVVLHWIHSNKRQKQLFVSNRVQQIKTLTNKESWRYCPTNQNPSDIASRGIKCSKIVNHRLWWKGPLFLEHDCTQWPEFQITPSQEPNENNPIITTVAINEITPNLGLQEVIMCGKYSNIDKLFRVTALVLRFIDMLKSKRAQTRHFTDIQNENEAFYEKAKLIWHLEAQKTFYKDPSFKETEQKLGTFVDGEGVIRVGGRLQNAPLPYSTKYPVLLPRFHHFTALIISKAHDTVKHNGVNETLTELRSEYWICKGRQTVKRLLSKCVKCKTITGKPYETPKAPPLPSYRVSEELAFTYVAIDFAGPLFIKDIYSQDGSLHKCYIALFSCASTRALHLELVPDLHAPTFIRALKRMINRRGLPTFIISDNGSTFHDKGVQRYSQTLNISWRFNVPTASWWGGFWEICVKLVKRCLKKTLGNAKLTYEELETALIEVEGILNSRPLTYVCEEVTETPLSPSNLVIGRRILDKHYANYRDSVKSDHNSLSRRVRYLETVLSHFRNRFKIEYLPSLREFHKVNSNKRKSVVAVGDIVHLYKDKIPRQHWPMGKVTKLLPGKDGVTRSVEVKTVTPTKESIIVKRPIQKLFPIEVRNNEPIVENAIEKVNVNRDEIEIKMVTDEDVEEHIHLH